VIEFIIGAPAQSAAIPEAVYATGYHDEQVLFLACPDTAASHETATIIAEWHIPISSTW
jgi:hypothetical protein